MLIVRRNLNRRLGLFARQFSNSRDEEKEKQYGIEPEHPIKRTLRILKNDIVQPYRRAKNFIFPPVPQSVADGSTIDDYLKEYEDQNFQTHCDVLIIGGGAMGSSIAYWLKKKTREGLNVVVVEKDLTYKTASTPLSVGGLRQQFSIEENVHMSLFGAEFLRHAKRDLGDVDVQFNPYGYLMLAGQDSAETLMEMSKMQNELGAKNEILTGNQIKQKFPWMNVDDVALGCHGLEKEGWFDPWALLCGMKNKAMEFGTHYHQAEVIDFMFNERSDLVMQGVDQGSYRGLDKAIVRMPDGEIRTIKFALCVIAAGANSGKIANLAKIGSGTEILSVPLPVEPRKRYVYCFQSQDEAKSPGLNTPMTIDYSGTYFRRDGLGGCYIGGRSPSYDEEPPTDDLEVDYNYFDTNVWPLLAHRVPSFEAIKVKSAWAGYYEMNTFDENGIVGPHPYYNNLFFATGFSGHGIQQAPAVGRAMSELIIEGTYKTIDLTRLGFDRIIVNQPMYEVNIV